MCRSELTDIQKLQYGILHFAYGYSEYKIAKKKSISCKVLNCVLSEILADKQKLNEILTIKKGYERMKTEVPLTQALINTAACNVSIAGKDNFIIGNIPLSEYIRTQKCPGCGKYIYGLASKQEEYRYIEFGFCGICTTIIVGAIKNK